MEILDIIKIVGSCAGAILSFIALITLFFKPIRIGLISWVRKQNKTDDVQKQLIEIQAMLQEHINEDKEKQDMLFRLMEANKASLRNSILHLCDMCFKKESITSIEKLNLIDMYKEYHNLGGDTYCTQRYEVALELPEKN